MLKNVHTQWISTLSLAKWIMKEHSFGENGIGFTYKMRGNNQPSFLG
jgi:hypothetical protein